MFTLHPQLAGDTFFIADKRLCRVLLMNNVLFPWVILVPRKDGARELTDLAPQERYALMDEIAEASDILQKLFTPDKMNVAALGNQVQQLHVHVIARNAKDKAWPHPVWGKGAEPYADSTPLTQQLRQAFGSARVS